MPSKPRLRRIPMFAALACVALSALVFASSASAADPIKRATRSCSHPAYFFDGGKGGYIRELRVTNLSCKYGNKFIKSYRKCRNPRGSTPRGTCKRKISRFSCKEGKRTFSDDGAGGFSDFSVRVTCRRGGQKIVHTYQQNLE